MKRLLVVLVSATVVLSFPLVSFGLNLSGLGTATVNGIMSSGEWDKAAKVDFQANIPEGGTTPATLYVMNDGNNLYLAVKITRSSFGYATQFFSDFDNNNNGKREDGDDFLVMYAGTGMPTTFLDYYAYTRAGDPAGSALGSTWDTNAALGILPAGTNDGACAANNDGSFTIMEYWHSLCSKDTLHDFCLKPGDTVGFKGILRLYNLTTADNPGPTSFADTVIPVSESGGGYGQITVALSVIKPGIDIKPGSRENSINRKSEGKIPVAILSSPKFDAPASIDRTSLTFGRTGDEKSLAFCNEGSEDVNGDGLPDLVCHFSTQLAGFQSQDVIGYLNGRTNTGDRFTAQDSVRIVK